MDSDDDDRYLDEVTRIKKASMLRKARLSAQDMVRERKEEQETDKFVNKHYKEEVERLNNLVKMREESLKEANYTIRKMEERLRDKGNEEKGSIRKEKKAIVEHDTAKGELEAKLNVLRKQTAEKDGRIDQILEVVTTMERNVSDGRLEAPSSSKSAPSRTIRGLLLKVRHGLINLKTPPAATAAAKNSIKSKGLSKSNVGASKGGQDYQSNYTTDTLCLEAQDKDITDSLFDVCRHLEEENARLLRKLGMEGDPESAELPPKVKKLISFYRAAIVRAREQLEETAIDLEREKQISRGLRHQIRQHQGPGVTGSFRAQKGPPTKGSNPYVGEGRIPHWQIDMSSASVAAEINELDSEIKHLQERLELAAVKKTQQAVAEALGDKNQ